MPRIKNNNWIYTTLGGILAIVFGVIALLFPSITLIGLTYYFAIATLVGGLFLTYGAIKAKEYSSGWKFLLFEGIIGILLGLFVLFKPEFSAAIFVTLIGIWALLMGLFFLIVHFKRNLKGFEKNFMLYVGILSLIFGLLIMVNPFEGSRFITVLIGLYAIAYGIFFIINHNKSISYEGKK